MGVLLFCIIGTEFLSYGGTISKASKCSLDAIEILGKRGEFFQHGNLWNGLFLITGLMRTDSQMNIVPNEISKYSNSFVSRLVGSKVNVEG